MFVAFHPLGDTQEAVSLWADTVHTNTTLAESQVQLWDLTDTLTAQEIVSPLF